MDLAASIKKEAQKLGFLGVGIAGASALQARRSDLARWLTAGFAGELQYMENFFVRQKRFLHNFPDLRSIIVLAVAYHGAPKSLDKRAARIARYAQGRDYHRAIEKRLKKLEDFICGQLTSSPRFLRSIDTSAVQERAMAEMAGLGFFGKNTCLILPKGGSFVFLAALLTNLELAPDEPIGRDCGECTLCLEACPTQALVRPYELDARRCISYLTIEQKGSIDPELRPFMHNWLFGCDICQEVCPYNKKAAEATWSEFEPQGELGQEPDLVKLLQIRTQKAFLDRFQGTPLMRAKRAGVLRNAAVVAGNSRDPAMVPTLGEALITDPSAIVREHAAWALEQIATPQAIEILQEAAHKKKLS